MNSHTITTKINSNFFDKKELEIFIKRDDLIHDVVSGNKWRKLKYNFQQAKEEGHNTLLSFGGKYSNHLHAFSYASKKYGFQSIGIVRGEENLTSTLSFCIKHDMQLHYLNRSAYRLEKYSKKRILGWIKKFGPFYMIPEGGNNELGVKGCEEIISDLHYDYICSPVGTGCTAAGLIRSLTKKNKFIGFSPFKKIYEQRNNILKFCNSYPCKNWELIADNHFNGFGTINSNLIKFVRQFYLEHNIKLDLVYMGKLFYSLFQLIENDFFPKKTKILVIHTGGIQGLKGFNFNY